MERNTGKEKYRNVGPRDDDAIVKRYKKQNLKAISRSVPPSEGDSTDAEMEIETVQSNIKSSIHSSASELHADDTSKPLQSSTSKLNVSAVADPDLTDAAISRPVPPPEDDSTDAEMEIETVQSNIKYSIHSSASELHAADTSKPLQSSTSKPTVSGLANPDITDAEIIISLDENSSQKPTISMDKCINHITDADHVLIDEQSISNNGGIIMGVPISTKLVSQSVSSGAIGSIITFEEIDASVNNSATSDSAAITISQMAETYKTTHTSPSIIPYEVVIRRSHDPINNDIFIEEVDVMEKNEVSGNLEAFHVETSTVDQPLDTSTPLGSPAISEIVENIMGSELSFSNIITPTSSMMINSSINNITNTTNRSADDLISDKSFNSETTQKKRKTSKKTDPGRKRKVHKSEWIDNKRKHLKNHGLEYTSRNGKSRARKDLKAACDDHCRLKCKDKVTDNIRKRLFDKFWALGNRVRQWQFLTQWTKKITKRRMTTEGPSKRKFTIKYYLPTAIGSIDEDNKLPVCKTMFLHTFDIGEGVVRTALKKISDSEGLVVESDDRGSHGNHRKVITDEIISSICSHVKAFSPVEAHYTRKRSSKLYLDGDLSMKKMFELYKDWEPELYPNKAQTLRQYTDTVNEHFNIEFHRPKKDQCDECVAYKNLQKPVSRENQEKYDTHIRNKELARAHKNEDKTAAINSPDTTVTLAFDFQKVLSAPHAETSILYYKRKLNVLNFTMFDMGQKIGKCYMWHEGVAKRGANDVASCVYEFISNQAEKGITEFYLYSDNCAGQNRNRIVFAMYMYASNKFKVNITHRFFEKGHTQNENDSIHALIERRAKNKVIYTPEQWYALVRWAKEEDPYVVKEMATKEFFDFKTLIPGKNWSKNEQGQKVLWTKVRDIKVVSSEPNVLNYKTDFDETEYQRLLVLRSQSRVRQNTRRANTRRPNTRRTNAICHDQDTQDLPREEFILPQAYSGPLPIPHDKLVDLKYLCDHNIIPIQYHDFFNAYQPGFEDDANTDDEEY